MIEAVRLTFFIEAARLLQGAAMSATGGLPLTAPPQRVKLETDFDTSLRSDRDFSPRQRGRSPEAERTPAASQRKQISSKSFGSVKEPIHPRSIWKPEDKDDVLEATGCLCHVRSRWGVNLLNAMQFPNGAFH